MFADLRYSLRTLWKRPSFTGGTVLVLALAVGVNTAVFSLIDALLLQPLPVSDSRDLAFIYHSDNRRSVWYEAYQQLQQKIDVFSAMAARAGDAARLRAGVEPVPLQGEAVTPNYFDVLGVKPRIGRTFDAAEGSPSAHPVAIISEGLWKSQFAGDPAIVGRILRIDVAAVMSGRYTGSRDYTIVGVMPASFTGTGNPWQPAQYWVLLAQRQEDYRATAPPQFRHQERLAYYAVVPIGRLKPGVGFERARAAVDAAAHDILARSPERMRPEDTFRLVESRRVRLPFAGTYFMDVPRIIATLAAVGTILLIIAGANLAGMLLARGVSRRSEIAVRLSLGISRRRLVRQLLVESLLLAIASGAAALVIARILIAAALHGLPSQLPGSTGAAILIDVPLNAHTIAFAFGSGLLTAIVVGLAPALQAMRVDLLAALAGGAALTGTSRSRLRRIVLVPQIALSLVLLLVTGVFVRALLRLELAPPGYDAAHVVALSVQYPLRPLATEAERRGEADALTATQARLLTRLAAIPGVTSAALSETNPVDGLPLALMSTTIIARSDYETTRQYRGVTRGLVSADYFRTLDIPLVRGRAFDARDRTPEARTVIVSERLAEEIWPGRDPVGQQIATGSPNSGFPLKWMTVVGVARSATRPLDEYPRPVFYMPIELEPLMGTTFLVRGAGHPAELATAGKAAIASADPSVLVERARPLEEILSGVRYPRRFTAGIVGASGTAALLLAAIGVFAMMSYAVAQRIGEIGVRMVLGAARHDIVRLILRDGAAVALAGIGIGFALAFAVIRYVSHAIVPLPDLDTATFVTVPLVLAGVVLLACYLPARRAARVDPMVVLRKV